MTELQAAVSRVYEHRRVLGVSAEVVRDGDEFMYEMGLDPVLIHRPRQQTTPITHAWAVVHMGHGNTVIKLWSVVEVPEGADQQDEEYWRTRAIDELERSLPPLEDK